MKQEISAKAKEEYCLNEYQVLIKRLLINNYDYDYAEGRRVYICILKNN